MLTNTVSRKIFLITLKNRPQAGSARIALIMKEQKKTKLCKFSSKTTETNTKNARCSKNNLDRRVSSTNAIMILSKIK
jgi:hypothetical protein